MTLPRSAVGSGANFTALTPDRAHSLDPISLAVTVHLLFPISAFAYSDVYYLRVS
jgi:hypothetical protein